MSESLSPSIDHRPRPSSGKGRIIAWLVAGTCVLGVIAVALTGKESSSVATASNTDGVISAERKSDPETETETLDADDGDESDQSASNEATIAAGPAPANLGPAGTLTNLDGWLQTDATSLEDFDGQVKILQFWTFSCSNCKATIANLQYMYETYEPEGLEIIGVHAPEFSFEEDPDAVLQAAQDLGVVWPIAIDNDKTNFRSWQGSRRFWPRTYVIDANGDVRFDHIGEGAYDELEETVAYLVQNGGA